MSLLFSPIGPALILLAGAAVVVGPGRWVRRTGWITGIALGVVGLAALLYVGLQFVGVVPTFSRPWQPLLQSAINLYWISDSWNYYVNGLILLLGGLGILLDRSRQAQRGQAHRLGAMLSANLAVLAGSLLFVNAGNLLTAPAGLGLSGPGDPAAPVGRTTPAGAGRHPPACAPTRRALSASWAPCCC